MGRALLIVAALAWFGCADAAPDRAAQQDTTRVAQENDPHKAFACVSCHRGNRADAGRASVPREACTAAGCHDDAGPAEVTLATARFEHRNHGANGDITLNCAGCHTHDEGEAPLRASLDACALCHQQDLADTDKSKGNQCRLCHRELEHNSLTSQGVAIAHGSLPWIETGCTRCHYDVLASSGKVTMETCTNCHAQTPDVTRRGIASDLHPPHRGVGCTSCHEAGLHRIGAMSSAVALQCADCHTAAHDRPVNTVAAAVCSTCHTSSHSAQQRLVLGLMEDEAVLPSAKFMMGLTCRSCHVPPGAPDAPERARRGQAAACVACHESAYSKVLQWWIDGLRLRDRTVGSYIAQAKQNLPNAPDTARALLRKSEARLALVRNAGGQHNLELSDGVLRTAVEDVGAAYRLAGRAAPAPPALGNKPHVGMCSFCHYAGTEGLDFGNLQPGIHDRLLSTRRPEQRR